MTCSVCSAVLINAICPRPSCPGSPSTRKGAPVVAILSSRAVGVLAVRHAQALNGAIHEPALVNALAADFDIPPERVEHAIRAEVLAGRLVRSRDSDGVPTLHAPVPVRSEAA